MQMSDIGALRPANLDAGDLNFVREPVERDNRAADIARQKRRTFEQNALFVFFVVQAIGLTVFQKFGVGGTPEGVVPVVVPLMLLGLGAVSLVIRPTIDVWRAALYVAFVAAAAASTGIFASAYSIPSLGLLVLLYVPMLFAFPVTEANYRRCMNFFSNLMIAMALITVAQHATQLALSWRLWPNLDKIFPPNLLIQNYVYLQPIVWGSPWMKPNAVFFLEVSFLSQFIALALAVELSLFRRAWRVALFAAVLLSTFAGTGVLLMLLTLPVLLGRVRVGQMAILIVALTAVSIVAFRLGWFDMVSHRLNEFNMAGRSANMRFIEPLDRIVQFAANPASYYSGIGAGQIEKAYNFQWWPITKVVIEYGFLTGILFYGFFLYTMFNRAVDKPIAFTLAVWFSIEGALLTSLNPLACALLSTLFYIPGGRREPQRKTTFDPRMEALDAPLRRRSRRSRTEEDGVEDEGTAVAAPPPPPAGPIQVEVPGTDGRLIYAVGDIHGRADLLDEMIETIATDAAAHGSQTLPMLVLLGDYIDRGPQSRETLDRIIALTRDKRFEVRCILGNHEEAMLDFVNRRTTGQSWGRHGGRETLASYGVTPPSEEDSRELWSAAREQLLAVIPQEHIDFLRSLEEILLIGDLVFVHAGLRPGVPIDQQSHRDLLFIRYEFLDHEVDCERMIVHGHTPGDRAYGAPGRLCLDSGAYASGVLTAAAFDGTAPRVIEVGRRG